MDEATMAALAAAVGGGGGEVALDPAAADPAAGAGNPTVDCPVCAYTLDAVTGEVVAGPEDAGAPEVM